MQQALPDLGDQTPSQSNFVIGGRRTDCYVHVGDGTEPIHPENVQVLYEPGRHRVALPPEVQSWRQAIEDNETREKAAGRPYRWNDPKFAVESLTVERSDEHAAPVVQLRLCDTDYYDFLATSPNLDRPLRPGEEATLRSEYLLETDPAVAPAFLSCSFGVNVAVETGRDRMMLFAHRSGKVAGPNTNRWNSSANEGLDFHDISEDGSPISLHASALRALHEELAVRADDRVDLELLAFALDLRNHQWAVFFRGVLPDLAAADLQERWAAGLDDEWEHDRFAFVPADPDSVLDFILGQPTERWTPCAPALFYLALTRGAVLTQGTKQAGQRAVEAAVGRARARQAADSGGSHREAADPT